MDCPLCNRAMLIVEQGGHTTGWICWDHGQFPCLCKCGIIQGMDHDILCEHRGKGAA